MDSSELERKIKRIVHEILERNKEAKELVVIGLKSRGEYLAKRIVECIQDVENVKVPHGNLDISLYRDDYGKKTFTPKLQKTEIPFSLEGLNVILVDDVIFTGRTIRAALQAILDYGRPSTVQLAVLIDRGHRELPIEPDYTGIKIDTIFEEKVKVFINELDGKEEVVIVQ